VSTGIQWTDETWNPIRGCSRVSEGCRNCYAESVAKRFSGPGLPYEGLTTKGKWNGTIRVVDEAMTKPLSWKKPRRVFVNSMSDLFHENVADETIDRIFAVMALAPQHTFQVLTKRPERMRAYLSCATFGASIISEPSAYKRVVAALDLPDWLPAGRSFRRVPEAWPLPNVWLGVSVEDQATADTRIPLLLDTPAAVRFISAEPLLGPINLNPHLYEDQQLHWVIVGGESGHGARSCSIEWVEAIVGQCVAAAVPVFVKQLGARPKLDRGIDAIPAWPDHVRVSGTQALVGLRDHKGGDMAEWPEALRVRQFPEVA
jgi:protein gp37